MTRYVTETLRLVSPSHCAVPWAIPYSIVLHTVLYQQLLTDGNQFKSSKVKVLGQEIHVRSDLNVKMHLTESVR